MSQVFLLPSDAEATAIVRTLRDFDRPIPISFLAQTIGRRPEEISRTLQALINEGVVMTHQSGKNLRTVELVTDREAGVDLSHGGDVEEKSSLPD